MKPPRATLKKPISIEKPRPTWEHEDALRARGFSCIAGVDEAGRGPLAGPVVAAAVILPRDFSSPHFARLHDSKQLTPELRAALFKELTTSVEWGVGVVDAATIDEINIRQASWLAMRRAVAQLEEKSSGENVAITKYEFLSSTRPTGAVDFVLIDGLGYGAGPWPYEALVKGDARCLSIAAASVIAKETRDALMIKYHAQFPQYDFARHKGYGTQTHLAALKEHGACSLHRRTFRPVREVLALSDLS